MQTRIDGSTRLHNRVRILAAIGGYLALMTGAPLSSDAQAPDRLGQIRVETDPPGATLMCNGSLQDVTPTTISGLPVGDHLLAIRKPGYREARRTVSLSAGQKVAVSLSLRPDTGLLLIRSTPQGASVEIEGAYRGETPLLITDLPLGEYRAKLTSQGYMPREVDLNLNNRAPQVVDVELVTDSAVLVVNSSPEGAAVRVNGIDQGITPCRVDRIPRGAVEVHLSLDGFADQTRTVTLAEGQEESMNVTMPPLPARLQVVTMPPRARIYVDNQFKGEAPIVLEELKPGNYRIRAELEGHDPQARDVTLGRGDDTVEEFRLTGNVGMLEITTEPAGVKVFVAGKESGVTQAKPDDTDRVSLPLRIDLLPAGRHKVQAAKSGYYTKDFEIVVERGKTVNVHQVLERRFITNYVVTTKDGSAEKGVLVEILPDGSVRLEVMPGIFKTIPAQEILTRQPLRMPLGGGGY